MLHCIKQVPTKGGENEFVDCFNVAEQLRKNHPEEFELLTTMVIDYKDIAHDAYSSHLVTTRNVIE